MNNTQTAYAFGQLGSAHCKTASSVYPPKGMVICAVQFLADNIPTVMRTEYNDGTIATDQSMSFSTEAAAHSAGEARQAISDAAANDTHTLSSANAAIKKGMAVWSNTEYLGADKNANLPATVVEHVDGTSIRFNRPITGSSTTLSFSSNTGVGGEDATGVKYPKGIIVYGRWTEVKPQADADGGVICYFGK